MYLGLDLGTGSLKALIVNEQGQIQASASALCAVTHPQSDWAESHPQDWYEAAKVACAALPADLRAQVKAIGFSGQMHGLVLTDAAGQPIRPALLWLDARTAPLLEGYRTAAEGVLPPPVNPITAGMFGPALLWLKQNEADNYARAVSALLPKDWLRLQLTDELNTDPSDVAGTLLATEDGQWHTALAQALGLNTKLLPPVVSSYQQTGALQPRAAQDLGLLVGVAVVAGAGDTAASLFGSGLAVGEAQVTVGSAAQIVRRLDVPATHPALQLYRAATPDWYALAAIQNAGLALEWVREMLSLTWEEAYAQAFNETVAADLAFLPYLTGERTPIMDYRACGSWSGLRLGHTRGQMMRAALEGVAFTLRDGLDTLEAAHGPLATLRLAGGGTRDPRWQQLLADALGKPLTPSEVQDASGRGAAMLGQWGLMGEQPQMSVTLGQPIFPGPQADAVHSRFVRWKALQAALKPWWEAQ